MKLLNRYKTTIAAQEFFDNMHMGYVMSVKDNIGEIPIKRDLYRIIHANTYVKWSIIRRINESLERR